MSDRVKYVWHTTFLMTIGVGSLVSIISGDIRMFGVVAGFCLLIGLLGTLVANSLDAQ